MTIETSLGGSGRRRGAPMRRRCAFALATAVTWLCADPVLLLAQQPGAPPPPGVMVETVREQDVAAQSRFTGRIEAIDKVELRARVQGFLKSRLFQEGSAVEKDALLFEIEKAPYEAAVAQAEANQASARAGVELARLTFDRTETLASRKTASAAQLDDARAKLQEAEAVLKAQEAALRVARLDLQYTEVRAPMAGRIGRAAYSVGDLVGPDSDPLATLVAQDPVYVAFPVPQRVLLQVRRGQVDRDSVVVRLELSDGSVYEHPGKIGFVDIEANPTTDTVTVRASVPNPEGLLLDRQLVRVLVESERPEAKLLVSQSALLLDQQGSYVLTVDAENKVEARRVTLGDQRDSRIVVEEGLAAGERVIVSGLQKVRPGMTVDPHEPVETGN